MTVASTIYPTEYIAARAFRCLGSTMKLIMITTITIELTYTTLPMNLASLSPLTLTFLVAKARGIAAIRSIAL